MNDPCATLWTIHELTAQVERKLAVDYAGASSGRIRDIPDTRTIRYYTTLGLLDRPAEMRGRTALYGRRHLLQLVAIKKLQAAGLSLSQVQERMAGATDCLLESLAGMRTDPATEGESTHPTGYRPEVHPRPFWKARPARVASSPPLPVPRLRPEDGNAESSSMARAYEETKALQAIELSDRVMLLLAPARPIDPEELPAICQAAAPLIRYLNTHKLIHQPPKGDSDAPGASPVE
jgi:DNA-binding transcriptional MerR regulator